MLNALLLASLLPKWIDPQHLISTYGTWAVLAVIFAECGLFVGFFLPGDSLLFLAGFFSAAHLVVDGKEIHVAPWYLLLPALFVAAVAGDQLGYFIGSRLGPALFDKPDARFFKQKYVHAAHEYLEHRGKLAIPLARFVPIVRTFTPIVVGVSDLKWRTYFMLDLIGGFAWAIGVTTAGLIVGKVAGDSIPPNDIDKYIIPIVVVIVAISLVPAVLEYRASKRRNAAASTTER